MQPTDTTNMSAAQLGNQAVQSVANPAGVDAAQKQVESAQGSYTKQLGDNATLPQLLSNSMNNSLDDATDPNRIQTKSDLATLLTALSNPTGAVDEAQSAVPGSIMSPGGQRQAIAGKIGAAGAALSMDNTIMGARGMGITGMVTAFSNYMAQHTQQLLSAVQNAQQNRDFLWNKAQGLGQLAMSAAQLKNQIAELGLQRETNPLLQAQKAKGQAMKDAHSMSFNDFMTHYYQNPALQGMTANDLYQMYKQGGGSGEPDENTIRRLGIKTGVPLQQTELNIKGIMDQAMQNPGTTAAALGTAAAGAAAPVVAPIAGYAGIRALLPWLLRAAPMAAAAL